MQNSDDILLASMEHAVFILKPDTTGIPRYCGMSLFAARVIGREMEEIIGHTASEVYPGRLGTIAYNHHVICAETLQPTAYEIMLPLDQGNSLIRTTLRPVLHPDGTLDRIVGSSADISGTQVFQARQVDHSRMDAEMEQFISMAAHDLRSPMLQICQIASFLREDIGAEHAALSPMIDMLDQVGERALRLIGDVLDHAQTASLGICETEFDFGALVADLAGLMDPHATAEVECTQAWLRGDQTATQIILRNLIDNALKYGRPLKDGQSILSIQLRQLDEDFVEVVVDDNGLGIDDPTLLFLSGQKSSAKGGFGLLGIRRLIHARGGTFKVSNRVQQSGTKVIFTLPGQVMPAPMSMSGVAAYGPQLPL